MSFKDVSLAFPLNPVGGGFALCLAVVSLDFPLNLVGGGFALFGGGFVGFSFNSRRWRFRVACLAAVLLVFPLNRVGVGFYLILSVFLICFLKGEGAHRDGPPFKRKLKRTWPFRGTAKGHFGGPNA